MADEKSREPQTTSEKSRNFTYHYAFFSNALIFRKFLIFIAFIALIIGCAQCLRLFFSQAYADSLFLLAGLIWVNLAIFSFLYNKDMPGVGPFSYDDGKNQLARIGLLIVIIVVFCLALIFN